MPNEGRFAAGRFLMRHAPVLPFALLIGGAFLDYFTAPRFSASAFYSAAPMTAAPLSLRVTVLAGLAACAADAVVLLHFGFLGHYSGDTELASVATVGAIAVLVNRLLHRSHVQLRSARSIAVAVQRAVLPQPPRRIGPLRVAARYEAAQAEARIGGDLYAIHDTPYGVRCLVGDVRGKGLGAVRAVNIALGTFGEAAAEEPTLAGLVARLERATTREAAERSGVEPVEGFITGVLAEIPHGEAELRLINRGHPAPLLLRHGTVWSAEPSEPALPLGLSALSAVANRVDTVPFPAGTTLLLYTDGIVEARNRAGTFYDLAGRLAGHEFSGPDALLDATLADVQRYTGGHRADDVALLAVTHGDDGENGC
ncbi:PP2C family protein-serine/threonine phosphatase [Streptomyces halobius]|uniref:Serine/threonine-protein phosphatase n=1 Tax=Streptomyces halobius TaxID=2879846 RepID=A0ABY4MNW7_9ACTN|nr:PP2C family protein-serine/threonine phosphatase [Streptomyces halobius]UQA98126.1 serine/threonine-protein phosphatase [Streptomyces halobius]